MEQHNEKTNYLFASIADLGGTMYTDQTGRFPRVSSQGMKYIMDWIQQQNTNIKFTPPDMHRQNAAEKAIQTWKNHFLAGLASLPKDFPIIH
eukprot:10601766-Ditylum_brightwellii.AAC.1